MATQDIQIGDGSLHIGDRVVYPNQGICRITGVSTKEIAGGKWEMVTLAREEDGATVMVPKSKVAGIGLRKVASIEDVEKVFDYFAAPGDDPQLDWKVRHRENADRMTGGGLFGTVEVLKGLHALSRVRPLPQKERELYDSARHLLVGEIAAALSLPLATAEDNLDFALWPPPGMTHKGKALTPATIGMALKPRATGGDDDLGFDDGFGDEDKEDKEEKAEKEDGAGEAANDEGGEAAPKPAAKPKAAKEKPAKAAPAPKLAPAAVARPAPAAAPLKAVLAPKPAAVAEKAVELAATVVHAAHKAKEAVLQAAHKAKEAVAHAAAPAPRKEAPHAAPAHHDKPVAKGKPAEKPAAKKAEPKPAAKKPAPKAAAKPAAKKPAPKAAPKAKGKK